MENIGLYFIGAIYIFAGIIQILVFADIILSWLRLAGINIRLQFVVAIIEPLYMGIKKIIPTTIGPLELAPLIVIVITQLITGMIATNVPEINAIFYK